MKVVRLHGQGDLRIHEEKQPTPGFDEVLLRVAAVGLCGSDLHWFAESGIGDARLTHPLVLGHEFAACNPADGNLVAVDPAVPCGVCRLCNEGLTNLCESVQFAGHGDCDGALRELIHWPRQNLYAVPGTMTAAEVAMLEPLGVALYATELGKLRPQMRVGVFGCGSIGLLILQLARLAEASFIVATDRLAHRLEAASKMGADLAIQVGPDGILDDLEQWKGDHGLDVVFEAAGDNPAVESAVSAARPGGRVVLVGIPSDDRTCFSASTARRKGLILQLCRRMRGTYPKAIELVHSGKIDVLSLVTHRFPLERAAEAFQAAQNREGIKVIIEI
jgi:L-iditol 2-dehydrogenase